MARRRLDHVDAMRPIKQAGVISTHSVMFFAPASAGLTANAALLLLHVSREGFFFISSCMLTYAYADLRGAGLRRYYGRRFVAVVIPYVCWTLIYFCYPLTAAHYPNLPSAAKSLGTILYTGYEQLYFLLVIMQFYLVFPLVLLLLRWTRNHHGLLIAFAAAAQVAISIATHWQWLPPLMQKWAQQDSLSYVLYLIGGGVVAFHFEQVHAWVLRNSHLIMAYTLITAIAAEIIYYISYIGVTTDLGWGSDPFQPSVIPFNVGAIACGYLAGVALVQPWRSRVTKALVRSGSDNAYGIYLTQMLFITGLTWLGWEHLGRAISWPLLCVLTVLIVFICGIALTSLLARTPLSVALTGRPQQPWSTLIPRWRPGAAQPAVAGQPAVAADADVPAGMVPGALAGLTREPNGACR